MKIADLNEDLLELILLHIPSHISLVRSAATCKRWRRLIAGAGFLGRFRSLHGPQPIGHYYAVVSTTHRVVFEPAPTPPGEAAIDVRHLKFLPRSVWYLELTDSHRGLLAFTCDLGVITECNPWISWEHKELIPPFRRRMGSYHALCLGAFLLDDGTDETGTMSHFKVLCVRLMQQCNDASKKTVEADVYSARDGRWLPLSTTAIEDIPDIAPRADGVYQTKPFVFLGRACGSLVWSATFSNGVFHLNKSTGEFSSLTIPRPTSVNNSSLSCNRFNLRVVSGDTGMKKYHKGNLRVITGDARTACLVRIVGDDLEALSLVRNSGTCTLDWRVAGLSQLANIEASRSSWNFLDTVPAAAGGPGCVVLSPDYRNMWMFSVETMTLERLSKTTRHLLGGFPYELPWPPTIKACLL